MAKKVDVSDVRLACVITTYDKVMEATGQMDIIRELWEPQFASIDIYHEFNGPSELYPEKYREDFLHRHKWLPHFLGAIYLINKGVSHVIASKRHYDYIVVASADTWVYDPKKIAQVIDECRKHNYLLATSLWCGPVLATEFFIIKPSLAKKLFPLDYEDFLKKYSFFKFFNDYTKFQQLETYFTYKILKLLKQHITQIYLIPGRKIVHITNRFNSGGFYASHHNIDARKKYVAPKLKRLLKTKLQQAAALNSLVNNQ